MECLITHLNIANREKLHGQVWTFEDINEIDRFLLRQAYPADFLAFQLRSVIHGDAMRLIPLISCTSGDYKMIYFDIFDRIYTLGFFPGKSTMSIGSIITERFKSGGSK